MRTCNLENFKRGLPLWKENIKRELPAIAKSIRDVFVAFALLLTFLTVSYYVGWAMGEQSELSLNILSATAPERIKAISDGVAIAVMMIVLAATAVFQIQNICDFGNKEKKND